jgi:glycerol uptake facilitator-like aquaporin
VLRERARVRRTLLRLVDRDLARRASAEAVGTALLVAVVVGSGIAAQRLSPGNTGLELLENALATGAGLVALILAFGSVSGAHFNPIVTLADRILGGTSNRDGYVYVVAQVLGACVGCVMANVMFNLAAINVSTHARSGGALWFSELIATFGLLIVIFGVVRAGRAGFAPFAVGAYITAAYWFTSSTSFANPAVTVGRTLSNTFTGIKPSSVPMFVVMQIIGGLLAVAAARFWYPDLPADAVVVPHEAPEVA